MSMSIVINQLYPRVQMRPGDLAEAHQYVLRSCDERNHRFVETKPKKKKKKESIGHTYHRWMREEGRRKLD